jgi:opacity protein-like surface antigen
MHQTPLTRILALAALALGPGAAHAAPTWDGWHAGIGIAQARGDDAIAESSRAGGTPTGYTARWRLENEAARAWVGHDWRAGDWTWGLEAAFDAGGGDGGTDTARTAIEHQWTLMGRVGRPFGRVMPWVGAGWTRADYAVRYRLGTLEEGFSPSADGLAWAVGVDWAVHERWWLRLAWQRTDLGDITVSPQVTYPAFDYRQAPVAEAWSLGVGLRF